MYKTLTGLKTNLVLWSAAHGSQQTPTISSSTLMFSGDEIQSFKDQLLFN